MNEEHRKNDKRAIAAKRKYECPHLRKIELCAEETLAFGCKMASGGNASGGFTCTMNGCSAAGS